MEVQEKTGQGSCSCRGHHDHGCGCRHHDHHEAEHGDQHDSCGHSHEEHAHSCSCGHEGHSHSGGHAHGCSCGHSHGHGEESGSKKWRLLVAAVLFAATFFPVPEGVRFVLLLASCLIAGWDVILGAVRNLLAGELLDEMFLMSVASIGAFCIGEWAEGAAVMLLYQLGELLQDYAVDRSRRSITDLMDIRPDTANRLNGEVVERCDAQEVRVGERILVRPGEKVPLDGTVVEGVSQLDTSALTGESLPRGAAPGAEVLAGFVNQSGTLTVEVKRPYTASTVSRVLEMVENASESKAPAERFITKFAHWYTPIVVAAAVLIALLPPLLGLGGWSEYIHRALTFLVISCPCALVISVPLSFFAGLGCASRNGILIKGGNYLEALCNVDTAVFDKTGTLTAGVFQVQAIHPAPGVPEEEVLTLAARAESQSTHPIAASIRKRAGLTGTAVQAVHVTEEAGRGVCAQVDGHTLRVGSHRLLEEAGIAVPDIRLQGSTVVHVARDGDYLGCIAIGDTVKADSKKALQGLKRLGVRKTVMLTGDHEEAARQVGEQVGVDTVCAELLPDDKVNQVERLLEKMPAGRTLFFVGDGINDAPVLARADVGVAMGGIGSDAAIEAADVVLMDDSLNKLPLAIRIARHTRKIAVQNISFVIAVKVVVLVLGAFDIANMWTAIFADVGVALLATVNSLRALGIRRET